MPVDCKPVDAEIYIHLMLIIKVIYLNYLLKRSLKCVMLAIFFNAASLVTRQNSYLKNHFRLDVIGLFRFDDLTHQKWADLISHRDRCGLYLSKLVTKLLYL